MTNPRPRLHRDRSITSGPLPRGDDDDPPLRPGLRRAFRITYIVIVVLVIAGLILMLFPWRPDRVPFPRDLPWQTIRILLPLP